MTTKTLDLNNIERKIFWALLALLGIVSAFYLYSVLSLTLAVVDRNDMNRRAHEIANSAGILEAEYLAQANSVTLAYAQNLGFREVNAKFTGDNGARLSVAR
ncbi:MAG: hypothetical protein A2747_01140 [Candidatus Yonathbacteria bacterium RIFCSPHIGHO2_01_FULL_44_41]|uniref:Uncharacterized protein n=1 Tax=Candidatus Yonathbacteria bacterium RIFCSPHIGHO2_02_FULL_44_14 TaxID=1802724 RepID=A0A1G2S6P5_9BACT|nr:MAG: hypothetical protein A2747_01140 [Candidatus Yonathbacteria bacterium RIFCSPHIGHO2_01_FULL_44_41]OHA80794.1 MAG: hypothetical protein A3D51_01535 [Candidatus Yonathbacteria bacterium RIFCSPHIGHO2_02_FULL_44_14]OHA82026.1 MAG: hypothetical protein A3B06_02010 [Candidatus Yonathbacteria bacterium RIFCSPLOWO2_01_FULL_43_20]